MIKRAPFVIKQKYHLQGNLLCPNFLEMTVKKLELCNEGKEPNAFGG